MNRLLRVRRLPAGAALAALLMAAAPAHARQPPPLEPIEITKTIELDKLPRPDGFTINSLEYAPDFEHFVVEVTVPDGSAQIAIADQNFSHFDCVTCDVAKGANKEIALADGKRLWFANNDSQGQDSYEVGGQKVPVPGRGGTGDFQWYMLECAPSLYDCRDKQVLDVDFPIDSLTQGAQNREANVDPLGDYVAWNEVRTAEGTRMTVAHLERQADKYVLTDPRVFNPPYSTEGGLQQWLPGSRFYEGGSWWAGNRLLKYQSTSSALNYDTFLLDTATGRRERITTDLDYNEIGDYSPDGRWFAGSSARGLDRMDPFSQIVRPALIDMAAFGQVGRVSLWNNRRCMNERWLWDRTYGQQLGGYSGQPVTFHPDWTVRQFQWLPDGTRALAREELIPNHSEPSDPEQRVRYLIVRLPARTPEEAPALRHVTQDEVDRWSIPAADYQGMASREIVDHTFTGPRGGTATVTYLGTFAGGRWAVTYDKWSEDGTSFLSGTESLSTPNPILAADYEADLTLTGTHTGHLKTSLYVGPQNTYHGTIDSELDGKRFDHIPTQADCPGIRQAPLAIEDAEARGLPDGTARIRMAVRAIVPEDAVHRPIRLATVTIGNHTVQTDEDGEAILTVPAQPGDTLHVRAEAGTFVPADADVSVR